MGLCSYRIRHADCVFYNALYPPEEFFMAGDSLKIESYSYQDAEDRHHEGVKIFYKIDAGKRGKIDVNPHAYNQYFSDLQVGDRLIKEKGEYMARKI